MTSTGTDVGGGDSNGQSYLGMSERPRHALRRRSILGPPSLFPRQRGGSLVGEAAAVNSGATTSESAAAAADEAARTAAEAVAATAAAGGVGRAGLTRRRGAEPDAIDVAMTIADLDFYYGLGTFRFKELPLKLPSSQCNPSCSFDFTVKRQLLRYQSCTTGLFPEHSSEPNIASVRSSIYANMALWALHQVWFN